MAGGRRRCKGRFNSAPRPGRKAGARAIRAHPQARFRVRRAETAFAALSRPRKPRRGRANRSRTGKRRESRAREEHRRSESCACPFRLMSSIAKSGAALVSTSMAPSTDAATSTHLHPMSASMSSINMLINASSSTTSTRKSVSIFTTTRHFHEISVCKVFSGDVGSARAAIFGGCGRGILGRRAEDPGGGRAASPGQPRVRPAKAFPASIRLNVWTARRTATPDALRSAGRCLRAVE